ncbi:MAG TPA: nuclear transport factor 2 family protein [Nitrososphaeraceae archaeon]
MLGTQNSDQDVREKNIKLIQSFLDLLEQKDLNAWINLWDEDGEQLNPYAPRGFPRILSGKNAIFHHWSGIPNAYGKIAFTDRKIYPTLDPDVIFTEFRGKIEVLKNNKNYNNTYCCRFTFSKGNLSNYVEYFDPIILLESLGDALSDTFNLKKGKH